jgi:DNA-binding GntR family transcriptional regulator
VTAGPVVEPVTRSTLGGQVTERLRELITSGHFARGTQLSEVDLAGQFGVSRGPVREALQHLVQEGLLRRDPRRGIFVPTIDGPGLADLFFVRATIEAAAMRLALQADPAPLAERLRATVRSMEAATADGDWDQVADLDIAFHASVVAASGSPRLARAYAGIVDETRLYLNLTAHYPGRESLAQEHHELASMLDARDTDAVLRELDEHLSRTIETLARRDQTATPADHRDAMPEEVRS